MRRLNLRLVWLVAIAALVLPGSSSAEERPVLELSLEQAVERALENNVDIAVQKFDPESSAQSLRQGDRVLAQSPERQRGVSAAPDDNCSLTLAAPILNMAQGMFLGRTRYPLSLRKTERPELRRRAMSWAS